MINQAPIVRYTASVSEKFFPNSWRKTFSAESTLAVQSEKVVSDLPKVINSGRRNRTF